MEKIELKGHLRPIILKILRQEGEKTGSDLAEIIKDRLGSKPSYGSIYPVLGKLKEKNLVEVKKDGKKKIYRLSEKGENLVNEIEQRKLEQTESMINLLKIFKTIFEDEDIDILIKNIKKKRGKDGPLIPELSKLHQILLTNDSVKENKKEIRGILNETLDKMKDVLEE